MSKKRTSLREVEWWWQRGWDPGLLRPNISIPRQKKKKIKARHGWAESKSKDESRGSQKYSVTPPKKEKEMLVLNPKAHPWCDFALHGYPTATDTPFQSLMT